MKRLTDPALWHVLVEVRFASFSPYLNEVDKYFPGTRGSKFNPWPYLRMGPGYRPHPTIED